MRLQSSQDIITYWFGDKLSSAQSPCDLEEIKYRMGLWFMSASPDFDLTQKENKHLFLVDDGPPSKGSYDDNSSDVRNQSPMEVLAKVITLDQFPRTVYRGTARAFAFDDAACSWAAITVKNGWCNPTNSVQVYSVVHRFFIGVCLQHSEDLEFQRLGVDVAKDVISTPGEIGAYFGSLKGYPHEHHDVIKLFGRFPSRNMALGRQSTEAEIAWMVSPECPAWARSQMLTTTATSDEN